MLLLKAWCTTCWITLVCWQYQSSSVQAHRNCVTHTPAAEQAAKDVETMAQFRSKSQRQSISGEICIGCFIIDTYFHRFDNAAGDGAFFSESVMEEQMQILNERYNSTPFQFVLQGVTTSVNDIWFWNVTIESISLNQEIGAELRVGNYAALNVYFIGDEEAGSFATFPVGLQDGNTSFLLDGVYINLSDVPGGSSACCNTGMTLIHEVGHWLGLYHTFDGDSCDPSNPNDYVDDTPQQAGKTYFECPADGRDTCPDLPGDDPIHNYMDYSSDECLMEFTTGQLERMYALFLLYRLADESCSTGQMQFELEVQFDPYSVEQQFQLATLNGDSVLDFTAQDPTYLTTQDNATILMGLCIPVGTYNFTIFDSAGDGIMPPGYYTISINGVLVKNSSDNPFDFESTIIFPPAAALVSTAPVTTSLVPFATSAPVTPSATTTPAASLTTSPVTLAPASGATPYFLLNIGIGWSMILILVSFNLFV